MKIIGIVGTAKNTGKTTTLAALIEESGRRRDRIAVTGIGYDGEEIDTVTGLPKPRLMLQPGTIVATSTRCLSTATAGYSVLKGTTAETALGPVVLVEITSPGLMVLAGPNTKRLLNDVMGEMRALGIHRLFVDGSLNRIAAMSVVGTMIFTTGASRSTEIDVLASEAGAMCRLFDPPEFALPGGMPATIALLDKAGTVQTELPMRSLCDADDAETVVKSVRAETSAIVIPMMAALSALTHVVRALPVESLAARLSIILNDPTIMLLAGEPVQTERCIDDARTQGIVFGYSRRINIAAMTVNPFYPRQQEHAFIPAFIDKTALTSAVSRAVSVPVFNIRDEGAPGALYSLL